VFKIAFLAIRLCWVGLVATTPFIALSAQDRLGQARLTADSGDVIFGAELVKTGLYLITGGGGNSLLRLSASGSILVDGNLPGTYRAQMSQVRKISKLSDLPVRVLVVTNHHENHTGNRAQFESASIPLIAQKNAKQHLLASSAAAESSTAAGKALAPTVDYDREYKLRMGGIEVQLFHFGNACTNGDTVVYFRDLRVVALGDLFTADAPEPDYPAGGSLVGWGPAIAQVLKLDFDIAVPGKGQMVTRTQLEAFKTRIDRLVSRARGLVKKGVAKDQLMAQLETDDLGWRLDFTGDRLDGFYAELSRAR